MIDIRMIAERDRSSVLHPFTQLKEFAIGKIGDPTIVPGGKGIRIENAQGRKYIFRRPVLREHRIRPHRSG